MGCVASKLGEEDDVVLLCRERKRLLKSAVERRYVLAEAHCKYTQSLYGVAAGIRLFVARHSSPSSPFLITFPPPSPASPPSEKVITNPMFLQQTPSESTKEAIDCNSSDSTVSSESSDSGGRVGREVEEEEAPLCGYFYSEMPPPMPSPQRNFGWDFFNPFDGVRTEVMVGCEFSRNYSDEDLKAVREEEGIPELEEEDEREKDGRKVLEVSEGGSEGNEEDGGVEVLKVVDGADGMRQKEPKGLTVIDTPARGRELLEALKDVEDHFIRAYDSGKDVSRMLEANRFHLHSNLDEIKENSTKLIQAITWHRSTSSQSSSCKSFLASGSKGSSTWTEFKNDLFDDYGGMESGSHSSTLGRLYAWEKKLYEEVKAGDRTRKIYEQKCSQLRHKDATGADRQSVDKTRASVKDLYTRILIAIRSAESISKRIEKLRDEELQPQLVELLQGLMKTWKVMLESHETQNQIMFEVKSFTCPAYGKFCHDSHRHATLQLEAELQNWRTCFTAYISAQRAYVESLDGWLSKFVIPEVELYSRGRSSMPPFRVNGPPLLVFCHDWLTSLEKLPDKAVTYAMKSFGKDIRALWVQQGEEQQQKRKVDRLAIEFDRRVLGFQRSENRILESKVSEQKTEPDVRHRFEYLAERKDQLDDFRNRLDVEKAKHHNYMQETQRITLSGFQTGFSSVFESLTGFCKASLKMYDELVTFIEKAKVDEKDGNPTYIESSQVQGGGERNQKQEQGVDDLGS
ncbi:protein ALTERED PHOSPHATE STARVATION RESPONSE 1-like [Macadamia integrifolia]|uniref:protein ALTERED PHOSPHATE STARVATION RESPONSE 1-like n=1 Tax=Macadamia integrifolia TaxID=60698 RepID=UPI001C500460|nr:protein ALTERED PHOSPHATE STARVATION RESPONSE 1-like [Macadamia integrifolia]